MRGTTVGNDPIPSGTLRSGARCSRHTNQEGMVDRLGTGQANTFTLVAVFSANWRKRCEALSNSPLSS